MRKDRVPVRLFFLSNTILAPNLLPLSAHSQQDEVSLRAVTDGERDGGGLCRRRSKYVNHSKCREVFLESRWGKAVLLSFSVTSKVFRLITTPEYMSAGTLLCRMSFENVSLSTHTHIHSGLDSWASPVFQKRCISKESSGWIMIWIMRQMCRKSRTQISGLKIDHSALWLWRWYFSALSFPFGHHEKDYATSQDLFVHANHHLIGQNPTSPRLNISNKMRASCSQIVASSSMSITWYKVLCCALFYCGRFWNNIQYRQCRLMRKLIRCGRCSATPSLPSNMIIANMVQILSILNLSILCQRFRRCNARKAKSKKSNL